MCRRGVVIALVLLGGCQQQRPAALHDDLGRAVRLERKVSRVVTLAPNLTEIAFAIGAGPKVVATDDYSDTPPAAARLPKVGGVQPAIERIAAARPDLVVSLVSGNHPVLASSLGGAGIPLYVVRTDRLDDVARVMERLGAILDAPDARRAADAVRRGLELQRRTRAHPPHVLFLVWTDPLYVAGRETFADDLLRLTGASNAVDVKGWPAYSLESADAAAPDMILYPDKSVGAAQIAALLRAAPQLAHSRIVALDENRFMRPGPRVAEAAADLNRIFDQWETQH